MAAIGHFYSLHLSGSPSPTMAAPCRHRRFGWRSAAVRPGMPIPQPSRFWCVGAAKRRFLRTSRGWTLAAFRSPLRVRCRAVRCVAVPVSEVAAVDRRKQETSMWTAGAGLLARSVLFVGGNRCLRSRGRPRRWTQGRAKQHRKGARAVRVSRGRAWPRAAPMHSQTKPR